MHIVSTLVIAAARFTTILAVATSGYAQAPSDDSAQGRTVQQTGALALAANDALFRRAEQLVREGRGEAGRAVVDSALARTQPGSPRHGQALYWKASLAADAAEAERGYQRVILEYPATRWAGDALVNLAQLEMARGDQEQALVHLHRFEREYPSHESRARASLWLARLHFDRKNERRGCGSLATARLAASPDDVELRNQIDHHAQRCIGVDTVITAPARSTAGATTGVKAPVSAPEQALAQTPTSPLPPPLATTNMPTASPSPTTSATDGGRTVPLVVPMVDSTARAQPGLGGYTVQVAAYDTRAAAEALIAKLKARGYTARLATNARPFRVRIGRYDTRANALAAQQRFKAKGIDGFVTGMERP